MSLDVAMPAEARVTGITRTMWLILIAVVMADALDLMDATLTMIAAPTIAANLGGGALLIKWLGSAYALALGSLLVVGGRLGDRFGQRRTFLIGIAGFTLASALCGLAPTSAVLIGGRLLQGGFGALLIPQGVAVLTSTFPRQMLGKAFSAFGPTLAVASVTGPLLGAFIVTANFGGLSWRPMFLINVIIGSIGFVLAWKVLPSTPGDRSVVLDGVGSGLLSAAMLMLIYGLIEGSTSGWTSINLATVVGGLVCFAAFGVRQVRAANPLIKPSLLANRGFTAGLVVALGFFSIVSGLGYVLSLFLQQGMGLTAVEAALSGITPLAVGIMIASFAAAPLIERFGRRLVLAGLVLTLAGVAGLWAVTALQGATVGPWSITLPVFVIGLGMGCGFGSLFAIALGDVDHAEAGSASGSLSAVQQLASAIGSAAITSIWFGSMNAGATGAMIACLTVVAVVLIGCMALVDLLPSKAAEEGGH
jgi:EmrB/QacA subfamily drug resistance transporter